MLTGCNKCHPWQFLIKLHKSRQKVIFLFLVQFGWHTIQLSQTLTFPLEIISLCKFFSQTVCVAQGKWAANGSDPPVLVEKYAWSSQRSHSQWHSYQKKKVDFRKRVMTPASYLLSCLFPVSMATQILWILSETMFLTDEWRNQCMRPSVCGWPRG